MHTYNPADDLPPDYEPDYDGEHLHEPDEMSDEELVAYHEWRNSLPRVEVAHACGHRVSYAKGCWGIPLAEDLCGTCQPYDDPFKE